MVQATVKPHWGVESGFLVEQEIHQLLLKCLTIGGSAEVIKFLAKISDGVSNSVNWLTNGGFSTFFGIQAGFTKVFVSNDISGQLRP